MTQEPRHHGFDDAESLPEGLQADLGTLYGASHEPPSRVDDAVLAAARARFDEINRHGGRASGRLTMVIRRIALVGGPLAAAAVLALVVWMTPWRPGQPQAPLPLPGTGRQQAQRMLDERVEDEMMADELAFEQSAREERLGLADRADDAGGDGATSVSADRGGRELARAAALASAPEAGASLRGGISLREDFDENGVVDMRDALAMAVVLEAGPWSMGEQWDLNGDGAVDADDVHVVALAAVDLERRGEVLR